MQDRGGGRRNIERPTSNSEHRTGRMEDEVGPGLLTGGGGVAAGEIVLASPLHCRMRGRVRTDPARARALFGPGTTTIARVKWLVVLVPERVGQAGQIPQKALAVERLFVARDVE